MKILFVHPATDMSIGDVARGYRRSLELQGHEISDYRMVNRINYHSKAIPKEILADPQRGNQALSRNSSETIVVEALCNEVDIVIIVSGLNVHPIALWLLGRVGIRVAVILTESPYEDEYQLKWADISHVGGKVDLTVFTNDRYSADKYGWHCLPPCFDPAVHKPAEPSEEFACDVMMVGTGWPERQRILEAVDWTGINLRLYGLWPNIGPDSPLHDYYYPSIISNNNVPTMYSSAKINLNFHRASPVALTPGPRVYELAACGAFQLSDPREDLEVLFRDSIPTFRTAEELEKLIRFYLNQPEERRLLAARALDAVCDEDFDKRAAALIDTINKADSNRELVGTAEGDR